MLELPEIEGFDVSSLRIAEEPDDELVVGFHSSQLKEQEEAQ